MSDPDLSLVATDELLDEVIRRSDAMIFASYQNVSEDKCWYTRRWHGVAERGTQA